MIDLTDIIGGLCVLVLGLISIKFIPYLKSVTSKNQFQEIQKWVKIAVQAAEMVFKESGLGAEKKEYVVSFLESMGFVLDFDKLDKMIESSVLELKQQNKEN